MSSSILEKLKAKPVAKKIEQIKIKMNQPEAEEHIELKTKINDNVFVAGCYNGSGIGTGTFFGEQIALMASNQDSDKISIIENRVKPTKLPTDLLLNIGVYTRLFYERLRATTEI